MGEVIPNAETLRRADIGRQFLTWLIPRLAGDEDEVETTLTMLFAHMRERYSEGVHDAAWIARTLSEKKPASRDLAIVAKALEEMEREHRRNPITSF